MAAAVAVATATADTATATEAAAAAEATVAAVFPPKNNCNRRRRHCRLCTVYTFHHDRTFNSYIGILLKQQEIPIE